MRQAARVLAAQATDLRSRLENSFASGSGDFEAARQAMAVELARDVTPPELADALAQSVVCSLPVALAHRELLTPTAEWLLAQATLWQRLVLEELWAAAGISPRRASWLSAGEIAKIRNSTTELLGTGYSLFLQSDPSSPALQQLWHFYEPFLREYSRSQRRRKGVFYTPQPIVSYIVGEIDRSLREEFGLAAGLASTAALLRILDPAVGTGAFLVEVIRSIHRTFTAESPSQFWDDYVVTHLLPRLQGIEILPAPCLLAQLHIAVTLAATGFRFELPGKINLRLGDALAEPGGEGLPSLALQAGKEPSLAIVLGNPPFSSLSDNRGEWIAGLVRGSAEKAGYQHFGGEKLGERKTWLHDDYVKFIRLAEWCVEEAGAGIVGLVTNHGYLDNTTFRLMRAHLLQAFSRISLVDLHGNRKKGEVTPQGEPDENVFGLDQGVAIGLFRRISSEPQPRITHSELWGSRKQKLAKLSQAAVQPLETRPLQPELPHYRFAPANEFADFSTEYERGIPLPLVMPVATTAPVTARDRFVVAFTAAELQERIAEFCDLSIPDEEIRRRYFQRTRSAKYPPGDTRGWKIAAARRILAAEAAPERFIRRCQYRPFDYRYVFWHPALIDWPRTGVMRHLLGGAEGEIIRGPTPPARQNLALIARRQMLPTHPCTFFWITEALPLDGIIRSDNLGSESIFPLFLRENADAEDSSCQANFAPEFIERLARQLGSQSFGPADVLHYIYALFHSPTYRERYAAELRRDFPRILLPRSAATLRALCPLGARLVELHLLRRELPQGIPAADLPGVNAFRVGGYEACRKWLQPAQRTAESREYLQIQSAIHATIDCMRQIDAAIAGLGGWTRAFDLD